MVEKKIYFFFPPTLNIICFVEKKKILRFCLCIFESDTVKSDCPMQENYELFKDLIQSMLVYFTSLIVCSGDIKQKKKNSENEKKKKKSNDQSTGHFQSFFSFSFFPTPQP